MRLSNKFQIDIFQKLRYSENYHINEIINALRIGNELKNSNAINYTFLAPMQSGKTGTIKHLCNSILPALGLLKEDESILFLTSMRDTDLREQNTRALEGYESNILVMPMNKFKTHGNKEIKKNKVRFIIRDEDQYGCGLDSNFDIGFFSNVRSISPNLPLICVSATPFDFLDAISDSDEMKINVIHGIRHENYFGISEMLKLNLVRDLPESYRHFELNGDVPIISQEIQKSIFYLNQFQTGIGIIRCSTTNEALRLKEYLSGLQIENSETILIACKKNESDFSIQEGLSLLPRKIRIEKKKIILIVIHALSAGKDLKNMKNELRFVIETRKAQLANCVQGLPGRACGYHKNRDILIYANQTILKYFSEFEKKPDLAYDKNWIDSLYFDLKIKTITTQTKLMMEQREGFITPIQKSFEIPIEDLFNQNGENHLPFLSKEQYRKLLLYFEKPCYENKMNVGGLKNDRIQLRISSRYKKNNTVFKSWNKSIGDNFKSIFNHKNIACDYGILISNYPKKDGRNEIDFCGLKLFIPGKEVCQNRLSKTYNNSMHFKNI